MKKILLSIAFGLFLIALGISSAMADPGDTLWTRTFGYEDQDYGFGIDFTADGGFILVGNSINIGTDLLDIYLVKTDAEGNLEWQKIFESNNRDFPYSVKQANDGGYVLCGMTMSYDGNEDGFILKCDSLGNTLWYHTFGGNGDDALKYIVLTSDGGYATAGRFSVGTHTDIFLVKLNANGAIEWCNRYGGSLYERADYIQQTTDGGFILSGSYEQNTRDIYLVKTDSIGTLMWDRVYGGPDEEFGWSVKQTADGGYIVAAESSVIGPAIDYIVLLKTDANGDSLWCHTFGGDYRDVCYSVDIALDGGFILGGYTTSYGAGSGDCYIIKTDADGNFLWQAVYGGTSSESISEILQSPEGYIIAFGHARSFGPGSSDFYLLKLVADGIKLSCETVNYTPGVPSSGGNLIWDITVTNLGSETIPVYGEIYPTIGDCVSGTPFDFDLTNLLTDNLRSGQTFYEMYYFEVRPLSPMLAALTTRVGPAIDDYVAEDCFEFRIARPWVGHNMQWTAGEWGRYQGEIIPIVTSLGQNYPNPFNATSSIPFELAEDGEVILEIYNLAGQLVETLVDGYMEAGQHIVEWDASALSSGVYFYKLNVGDRLFTKRMTLLK